MLKKMLPVAVGLVLIILIALTVSVVKKSTNRTPSVEGAKEVYAKYGDYEITKDRIYTLMKNNYGVSETLTWVDEQLFADEIAALDVNDEDFVKYIKKSIFDDEEPENFTGEKAEEAQKKFDDVITTLRLNNQLSATDAADKDYTNEESAAWKAVKDFYKLDYVRNEWAKAEYLKKYLERNNKTEEKPFEMTKAEDATNSIEAYFEANYSDTAIALFVPFTSIESAKAMMNEVGINVDKNVLDANDQWISNSYDYYTQAKIDDGYKLEYTAVVKAFFDMYNKVFAYLNDGNEIITTADYEEKTAEKQTAYLASKAIKNAFDGKSFGANVDLPTTVSVNGEESATVTWTLSNNTYASLNNEGTKVIGNFENGDEEDEAVDLYSVNVTLNFTVKFGESEVTGSKAIKLVAKYDEAELTYTTVDDTYTTEVTVSAIDAFKTISFTDAFLEKEFDFFNFKWDKKASDAVNTALTSQIIGKNSTLVVTENPDELYKSYTVTPVAVGNYYFLILKLEDQAKTELFKKDSNGNNEKDDNNNYIINDNDLYKEIVDAKLEELVNDNAIDEMIYENRYNHGLKLFDAYIEAMYEYEYNNFYETTLAKTEFNEFKKAKKNKKTTVVSIQKEAGNKKSAIELDAEELFAKLESKYASNYVTTLIDNYILISDEKYNNIYNPYTKETLDKATTKNLLESEVSNLKKNFEADYFTYSYLSYYGFTPNFPAKYGWSKFIKDYFIAFDDYELLTVSTYGGSIYTNALSKLTKDIDLDAIKEEMQKSYEEYFSVNVLNLLITLDFDYNADNANENDAQHIIDEKDHWTTAYGNEAQVLAELMFEVAPLTNEATLSDQMNALVTLYNNAAYEYDETAWENARTNGTSIYDFNYFGRFKLEGLNVKFETAASYNNTSSIVKEFAEECNALWDKASELGLVGKTFDVPVLSDMVFTDYGYHKIACIGADERVELPTDEAIKEYRAISELADANSELATAKENLETYKANGYNVASYEAAVTIAEDKVAKAEKALTDLGKDKDYTLEEDIQKQIDTWYTPAEEKVDGGTLLTKHYINEIETNLATLTFNTEKLTKDIYSEYLSIVKEECQKQDEE